MVKLAFGSFGDSFSAASLRAYVAEFIATLLFVFAGVGSAIAYSQLTKGGALDPAGLVAIAIAHAFALFVGVSMAANISGGHLNPAVTFGLAVGGHITILTGLFYWVAQLLGASVACLLLQFVTHGKAIPTHAVSGISEIEGVVMEIVITFALVYTVYATAADPKKGSLGTIAPIAIGFIVGANILAAGPFSGGSMNPARSFGPAVAAGSFAGNWVYWVGPLIGGGLAGLVYGDVFIASYQSNTLRNLCEHNHNTTLHCKKFATANNSCGPAMASSSNLLVHLRRCVSPPSLRAYCAEFMATFLFVFTAVGSTISARMVTPDVSSDAASLVATAVAQAFGLFAAVLISADVSGGHANPAVTFAFAIGGHIGAASAIFYWASQMLGSVFACLITGEELTRINIMQAVPTTRIAVAMTGFGAAIMEAVLTFMVVYTAHVAGDLRGGGGGKRRGFAATALGAVAVGSVTGACVLSAGSLTGASMNPARSFGPAVVSGDYKNQAVYWAGPMIGAAVAALAHQILACPTTATDAAATEPSSRHGNVETVVV
nr:unnamed protein product [Digitaria exilis]